ncbi:MAG: sensor domain-containing diguanylate cyclase [Actinomycetia bacterium]|nr:sensor domain-containing diguanylate cyclase [Actinomycetes bacterium]MCH9761256.1 sensor domain-containing diguanylate cyclase [Actinomycetes bacterium]
MDVAQPGARRGAVLLWWGRAAVVVVLVIAVVDWVGWATGIDELTRTLPAWPHMTPWSAALLAALGLAIVVQSGQPSRARKGAGCGVAAVVGVLAAVFLAEYASGRSFGLDQMWFPDGVRSLQETWPGRPSPNTAAAILLLSIAAAVTRQEHRWARTVWPWSLLAAMILPSVAAAAYLFDVVSLASVTRSTGMGISTALGLLLLVGASLVTRPDRNPLAWLLARPDARTLLRLATVLAGLPVLLGLSRLAFLSLGAEKGTALVLAVLVSTVVLGAGTFYVSQREQKLLIDKERLSSQRAEAEARYRVLAENLVDVVVLLNGAAVLHLHGTAVQWVSPSVQTAFGDAPPQWIGSDFSRRIHPDDIDRVDSAFNQISPGNSMVVRFRVRTAEGDYRWVDGHCKPYVTSSGDTDGVLVALRLVDDLVQAQRELERLARFDTLTGLVNRGEAIARLQTALSDSRKPGLHLGLLFCDVDEFKAINDTWGHAAGDVVLATVADRIRDCVRAGDTVGRTGGDEILVLLPGVHSLEEVVKIAEKIRSRAAEPIYHGEDAIHATLSIGATLSHAGESADTVTARADAAMYQAKDSGRNTVTIATAD